MTTLELQLKSKTEVDRNVPVRRRHGCQSITTSDDFKDKPERRVLPVWLSPIDAGIAVTQSTIESDSSPHTLSVDILNKWA